ncbi:MurR/RpiR family transcriptional regulator [Microbacterium aurum]|jgi:DNA-binding MurR/RpiR family transcriptional regulator|uniref:MurR/RpiR family transcriptional regulator n=1 Tax=Microbacterium aurum TaxID=36805 RepID=UPI00248E5FDE|nr:MurR/RpiR family transcriptional regulator [Microbacterium aurum]MBZ6370815.1 MurR/RpiR family transcriptional regulator [Microbacterium hominis]
MTDVIAAHDLPLVEGLRSQLRSLTPAERRVADTILRDPLEVIHLSVSELATLAETSAATVVRLCTSIGLRGYQDLKITLAKQSIPSEKRVLNVVDAGDDADTVSQKVFAGTAAALEATAAVLNAVEMERIADAILGASRVQFGAVGTSAPLAQDAAYRLTTIGIPAIFIPDVHAQHVSARMLGLNDLFFAISHTGSTIETLAAARAARNSGARTAALTSFRSSPLTETVEMSLIAGSAETAYRVEAMTSRIVHFVVLDALYVILALRRRESVDALALTEDVLIEHRL